MSRVFVTGSSTGLGLMAAQLLIDMGHQVVVHGRNRARADAALAGLLELTPPLSAIFPIFGKCVVSLNRSTASAGSMP